MIIEKVIVTAKKTTVQYRTSPASPILHTVTTEDPLPGEIRTKVEGIAQFILDDSQAEMEHEQAQAKFTFTDDDGGDSFPEDGEDEDFPSSGIGG